jgi:translation elongation factor EF-1alpha
MDSLTEDQLNALIAMSEAAAAAAPAAEPAAAPKATPEAAPAAVPAAAPVAAPKPKPAAATKKAAPRAKKVRAPREPSAPKLIKQAPMPDDDSDPRPHMNAVFIGHVDAGKSTICGSILYHTGQVDERTIAKFQKEAKAANRESWFLAFILDTNEEERAKGKTVEVGRARFATENKRFTVLDAPGHRNYVPNMISGASQADVGVLVISARRGEFEAGFEKGGASGDGAGTGAAGAKKVMGQTREHALLAKTLGVSKLVVCVNKMDEETVQWSKARYDEIVEALKPYLRKSCGYKVRKEVLWLPMSGITGEGLHKRVPTSVCPWCVLARFFFPVPARVPARGPSRIAPRCCCCCCCCCCCRCYCCCCRCCYCQHAESVDLRNSTAHSPPLPVSPVSSSTRSFHRYDGPSLFEVLDGIEPEGRDATAPLRVPLLDKWSDRGTICMGKVEAGTIYVGQKVVVEPLHMASVVMSIEVDGEEKNVAKVGENVNVKLKNIDADHVQRGFVICDANLPCPCVNKFVANIQLLELLEHRPILTAGYVMRATRPHATRALDARCSMLGSPRSSPPYPDSTRVVERLQASRDESNLTPPPPPRGVRLSPDTTACCTSTPPRRSAASRRSCIRSTRRRASP